MAKVSVYDKKGIEFVKEPIDARECVSVLGWTMEKPEEKKTSKPKASANKPKAVNKPAPVVAKDASIASQTKD